MMDNRKRMEKEEMNDAGKSGNGKTSPRTSKDADLLYNYFFAGISFTCGRFFGVWKGAKLRRAVDASGAAGICLGI
jgi:hypothetical protein